MVGEGAVAVIEVGTVVAGGTVCVGGAVGGKVGSPVGGAGCNEGEADAPVSVAVAGVASGGVGVVGGRNACAPQPAAKRPRIRIKIVGITCRACICIPQFEIPHPYKKKT